MMCFVKGRMEICQGMVGPWPSLLNIIFILLSIEGVVCVFLHFPISISIVCIVCLFIYVY